MAYGLAMPFVGSDRSRSYRRRESVRAVAGIAITTELGQAVHSVRIGRNSRGATMEFQQFLDAVARRSNLGRQDARAFSKAALQLLGEQINRRDMQDLLSELPTELAAGITQPASDQIAPFPLDEFVGRVAQYAEVVDADQARASMQGLFTVLSDAAGPDRLRAAIANLQPEYETLLTAR